MYIYMYIYIYIIGAPAPSFCYGERVNPRVRSCAMPTATQRVPLVRVSTGL